RFGGDFCTRHKLSTLTSCSLDRLRHWGATEHHALGMALVRTLPTSCAVGLRRRRHPPRRRRIDSDRMHFASGRSIKTKNVVSTHPGARCTNPLRVLAHWHL